MLSRRFVYRQDLGAGGMGCVALVEDLHESRRLRALKWVGSADLEVPNIRRHRHEYQLLSTWRHPHVLSAYDFARLPSHDLQFFTMDYLRGPSFAEILQAREVGVGRRIVGQLLHALGFVHHQGWVHCDVKPHNILLCEPLSAGSQPQSCLIDFGLAGEIGSAAGDRVLGTVHYMSPERFHGARLDSRSDLYAVGVILYQLITGRLPFLASRKVDVILRQLHCAPVPVSAVSERAVAPALEQLVQALLEKDPANRPVDSHEVVSELAAVWPEVDTREGPELLRAYASRTHHAGWEAPLQRATGRLMRSTPCCEITAFEIPEFRDDDAKIVLPLCPSVCGAVRARVGLIVGTRAEDLERFARAVVRRAEILGVPQINLRHPEAVFSRLTASIAEIATARVLGDAPRVQQAAMRLDHAVDRGEGSTVEDLDGVAGWMRRAADEVPFLVVLHRREVTVALLDLLGTVEALDSTEPGTIQWMILGEDDLAADLNERWSGWCDTIHLERLDPESHVRWWTRRLGDWRPPPELDAMLERECDGSPAVLERLFSAFIDSGMIERVDGRWAIGPRADLASDAVTPPEGAARSVLEAIAIAGTEATIEVVAQLAGRTVDSLRDALAELDDGWVVERDRVYEFVDLRDHFAIKDTCSPETWRSGRAAIARIIESGPERPDHAERLARAWLSAGEIDLGLRWTRRAVTDRIRAEDLVGTQRILERAVESTGALPEVLAQNLISLRRRFGPIAAARPEVLDGGGLPDDAAAVLLYAGEFAVGLERAAHVAEPSDDLRLAVAEASLLLGRESESIEPLAKPDLEGWRVDLEIHREENDSVERAKRIAGHALRGADGSISASWQAYLLGRYHSLRGRPELAIPCFRIASFGFGRRRSLRFQARSLVQQGLSLAIVGSTREADFLASRTQELVTRVGGIAERLWLERLLQPLGTSELQSG